MYRLVIPEEDEEQGVSYRKLLEFLDSIQFDYIIARDANRAEDGVGLRYRFAYEAGVGYPETAAYLDDRPCSVLEMLVALSLRCEEQFMADPEAGNRTSFWFGCMLHNLGIDDMDDLAFRKNKVKQAIDIFMQRDYEPDGKGGLFHIENCWTDLRQVEIWYQMCWYLDTII